MFMTLWLWFRILVHPDFVSRIANKTTVFVGFTRVVKWFCDDWTMVILEYPREDPG